MNISSMKNSIYHNASSLSEHAQAKLYETLDINPSHPAAVPLKERINDFYLKIILLSIISPFMPIIDHFSKPSLTFIKNPNDSLAQEILRPLFIIPAVLFWSLPKEVLKSSAHDFFVEVLHTKLQNTDAKKDSKVEPAPHLSKIQKIYYTALAALSPLFLPLAPLGLIATPLWAKLDQKLWGLPKPEEIIPNDFDIENASLL